VAAKPENQQGYIFNYQNRGTILSPFTTSACIDILATAWVWAHELMHMEYVLSLPFMICLQSCTEPRNSEVATGSGLWAHTFDLPVPYYPKVPYDMKPGHHRYKAAYGPLFTKWLAQSDYVDEGYSANNADSYAMFMMANCVNRKKGFYPSMPQVPIIPSRAPKTSDLTGNPVDDKEAAMTEACNPLEVVFPTKSQVSIIPLSTTAE
jgi:hypothetical protein